MRTLTTSSLLAILLLAFAGVAAFGAVSPGETVAPTPIRSFLTT
jgi:hypothetical protein